jgi:hypothetical protein
MVRKPVRAAQDDPADELKEKPGPAFRHGGLAFAPIVRAWASLGLRRRRRILGGRRA